MAEQQETTLAAPAPQPRNQLEYKGPTALTGAGQSITYSVEYAPDVWVVWLDPGAAGSGVALVYVDGTGTPSGYSVALAPGGRVRIPGRHRSVTIAWSSGAVVVSAAALSGAGRDFDVLPQSS